MLVIKQGPEGAKERDFRKRVATGWKARVTLLYGPMSVCL